MADGPDHKLFQDSVSVTKIHNEYDKITIINT